MMQHPGIDYGLCRLIGAAYDKQIRDHHGLAFLVLFDDLLLGEPFQRHTDHRHSPHLDLLPRRKDRIRLLPARMTTAISGA